MSIHEFEKENQERLNNAYKALSLPDPAGYTGTTEREYQKELARNLQNDGSKAISPSMDQRIAGKLKAAGYSLSEIEEVVKQHSPMAVKPNQEQRQAYAKNVIQKAYFSGGANPEKQLEERRLEQLGIDTKVKIKQSLAMGWKLFLVDRDLSNHEIATTFAEIFEITEDDVIVFEEVEVFGDNLSDNIQLICERTSVKGDFQLLLTIYLQGYELEEIAEKMGELEIIGSFSEILGCNCLILDPSKDNLKDEDSCLFLQGLSNLIQEVFIDPDTLDNNEYIITNFNDESSPIVQELLKQELFCKATDNPEFPYRLEFNDTFLELRINDFPEESLYTLFIDSKSVYNFDDLPDCWQIP